MLARPPRPLVSAVYTGRSMGESPVGDRPLKLPLEIEDIKAILPHRSPFLLVDRVIELEPDRRVVAVKNVTTNERYFIAGPGGVPTMPASILTEAMAQAGAILILSKPENRSRLIYFMGIDRVRYRRPVVAGDVVVLEGVVLRLRAKMGILRGRALVDGKIACEGEMTFALGDRPGRP
jgi:3-hydroxyacyl-[acyl-carrier-protein] dehydratase